MCSMAWWWKSRPRRDSTRLHNGNRKHPEPTDRRRSPLCRGKSISLFFCGDGDEKAIKIIFFNFLFFFGKLPLLLCAITGATWMTSVDYDSRERECRELKICEVWSHTKIYMIFLPSSPSSASADNNVSRVNSHHSRLFAVLCVRNFLN